MNFNDFLREADYKTIADAWKSGAAAMLERLVNLTDLNGDAREKLIEEEVDALASGRRVGGKQ